MARQLSPVVKALRVAGDEVQLGRVLAAVLSSEAEATNAFLKILLQRASEDESIGDRAASVRLPAGITCSPEQGLIRRGRGRVRGQAKHLGRADLFFAADDFRLICELKIDSDYGKNQLRRYLETGGLVISIVRNPNAHRLDPVIARSECWLGEIAWNSIIGELRSLPLRGTIRQQWLHFLAVAASDGDFAEIAPRRVSDEDVEFVQRSAQKAIECLASTPGLPAAHRLLLNDFVVEPRAGRRYGLADVIDDEGNTYWCVTGRDSRTRSPEFGIEWIPWPRTPAGSQQQEMHRLLESKHGFRRRARGGAPYYSKRETLTIGPHLEPLDEATNWVYRQMDAVRNVGLLDYDADTWYG